MDMHRKVLDYFSAGSREVWVLDHSTVSCLFTAIREFGSCEASRFLNRLCCLGLPWRRSICFGSLKEHGQVGHA